MMDGSATMTLPELALAILVLLLTPGPTNTLLLLGGAERGPLGAFRLIPAELAGYMVTVVPLALAGGHVLETLPVLRPVVALLAAAWVAWLAFGLWRRPATGTTAAGRVTARNVFVTTVLNPKALLFGLVLLPSPTQLAAHLALFGIEIVAVAAAWAMLGSCLSARSGAAPCPVLPILRRVSALWLAVVAASLVAKGFTA
jgi:threonine/homoserine/homoserine lactone efflux protein